MVDIGVLETLLHFLQGGNIIHCTTTRQETTHRYRMMFGCQCYAVTAVECLQSDNMEQMLK